MVMEFLLSECEEAGRLALLMNSPSKTDKAAHN
jgi:hypothetical protein